MTIFLDDDPPPVCEHREWLPDDEHFASGPLCGQPATFFDCGTTDMTVCAKHKCRCRKQIRTRREAAELRIGSAKTRLAVALAELAEAEAVLAAMDAEVK